MKKKIDYAIDFLENNIDKFICPICQKNLFLKKEQKSLVCEENHTFDISKKGSIQLVNKFVKSDYDEELFNSRSFMMNSGLFAGVFKKIIENIGDKEFVVDAGSGEGSALIDIVKSTNATAVGFDLASEGIFSSTRGLSEEKLLFAVSNLANIPLKNQSVDTIVNLLSPASYDEFQRILKPTGQLLKIIPNSNYLIEIRKFAAQRQDHIKETYDNKDVLDNLKKQVADIEIENINYEFLLNSSELKKNMFAMTPLTWSLPVSVKQEFIKSDIESITVDLQLLKIKF